MSDIDIALGGCTCDHGIGGCAYCALKSKRKNARETKERRLAKKEKKERDTKLLDRNTWTSDAKVRENTYCFLESVTYPITNPDVIKKYFEWLKTN